MYLETQKEIEALISIYRPDTKNETFLGMAIAMLTEEQAETMKTYLEKWIGEKNA
jgi:hypothetical protein